METILIGLVCLVAVALGGFYFMRSRRKAAARRGSPSQVAPQQPAPAATLAAPDPDPPVRAVASPPAQIKVVNEHRIGGGVVGFVIVGLLIGMMAVGGYFGYKKYLKPAPKKVDPCAVCKVEKVPLEQLTCEQHGTKWRFLGHKCIGQELCDACIVADCESDDMETPPAANGCNRCSKSGD